MTIANISNGESLLSVRTKLNTAIDKLNDIPLASDYASLSAAISAASSGGFVVGVVEDTTIRIPTDAPTLQDAFDHVTPLNAQCQIDVLIEAGHQPASGVTVADGDFGQWSISSVSATVILDAAFTGRFINSDNAHAPTLNTYVIAHSGVDRIYSLFGSIGKVNPNCGGEGTSGRILYGNASNIQAGQTIWKNHGDSIYFSAGSAVQLGGFTSDGATVTANGALTASRGSSIEAAGCTIKNCWFAVECKRAGSSINMHDSTIDTIGRIGIRATRGATVSFDGGSIVDLAPNATGAGIEVYGATISAGTGVSISYTSQALIGNYAIRASNAGSITCDSCTVDNASVAIYATTGGRISSFGSTITNAGYYGVQCRQGSHITVSSATVTGSGTNDLRVTEGGIIAASGCTTSNGVGSPNVIDTNLDGFGGLNAFGASGRGIIFA